nr:MAG TPA: hypothetical protein [Caudoviricetes sp.]
MTITAVLMRAFDFVNHVCTANKWLPIAIAFITHAINIRLDDGRKLLAQSVLTTNVFHKINPPIWLILGLYHKTGGLSRIILDKIIHDFTKPTTIRNGQMANLDKIICAEILNQPLKARTFSPDINLSRATNQDNLTRIIASADDLLNFRDGKVLALVNDNDFMIEIHATQKRRRPSINPRCSHLDGIRRADGLIRFFVELDERVLKRLEIVSNLLFGCAGSITKRLFLIRAEHINHAIIAMIRLKHTRTRSCNQGLATTSHGVRNDHLLVFRHDSITEYLLPFV